MFIDMSLALRLTETLMHFLWQGAALLILVLLAERLLRPGTSRGKYVLQVLGLLGMALCVPVTFFLIDVPKQQGDSVAASGPEAHHEDALSSGEGSGTENLLLSESASAAQEMAVDSLPNTRPDSEKSATVALGPLERTAAAPPSWLLTSAPWITSFYLAFVSLFLLRFVRGVWSGHRFKRKAAPLRDDSIIAAATRYARQLGLRTLPALVWCEQISIPIVIGVIKPVVLLPAAAATGLSPDQLQALIAHELAHIRRYDLIVNLLQRLIESVLFFHPAVWILSRRISSEREMACDEKVLESGWEPVRYADALVRMAELSSTLRRDSSPRPLTSLASTGREPSEFKRRVLKIMGEQPAVNLQPSRVSLLMLFFAVILAFGIPAAWQHDDSAANASFLKEKDQETEAKDPDSAAPVGDYALYKPEMLRFVSLSVENTPLKSVIETLAQQADLTAEFDLPALKEIGLDLQQPISADIERVPLGRALTIVTDSHYLLGLRTEVRGKTLMLTSQQAWQSRLTQRLPEWMRPLYNQGLSARLEENNEVITVTAGQILTDDLLAKIAQLPQLRELHIETTTQLTPAGMAHLGEMSRLEKLSIYSLNTEGESLGDAAIRNVVGLNSLRDLSIGECGTTDAGAKLLEQMPQLKHLSLRQEGHLTDEALKSISKLANLESLSLDAYVGVANLGWMRFSSKGLQRLSRLKNLQSLHLVGQQVTADSLNFPKLTSLSVGNASVDDEVALKISELRSLQHLELMYCRFGDEGMKAIAGLPELRKLSISSAWINDAGIAHLRTHKHLEQLTLRVSGLSDRTLENISQIKTLTRLDLYGSGSPGVAPGRNFTSTGLQYLSRLPNLRTLWLSNMILDGGYTMLKDCRQLEELTMMMCDVTDTELYTLEDLLPNANINHMTGGGGWIPKRIRESFKKSQPEGNPDKSQGGLPPNGGVIRNTLTPLVEPDPVLPSVPSKLVLSPEPDVDQQTSPENSETEQTTSELSDLRLEGEELTVASLETLAGRDWGTVTLAGAHFNGAIVEALRQAKSIRTLRLFGEGLSGQITRLRQVSGLEGLELGCPLTGRDLQAIGKLASLEHLSLPKDLTINVTGARAIAQLVNLRSLKLYFVNIDDASFAELRPLTKLEQLDLSHTSISDQGLVPIAVMPRLKKLELTRYDIGSQPKLTDACLPLIVQLSELESLTISGDITDAGLKQIARLPKLNRLNLCNTQVTLSGLAALQNSPIESLVLDIGIFAQFRSVPGQELLPSIIEKESSKLESLRKWRALKHIWVRGQPRQIDWDRIQKYVPDVGWGFSS